MDEDGYPTAEEIAKVAAWPVETHADCLALLSYLKTTWWNADWGWTEHEEVHELRSEGRQMVFEISTGGWSGNEQLVTALIDNQMFWLLAWYSTRRGGHYTFKVEVPK